MEWLVLEMKRASFCSGGDDEFQFPAGRVPVRRANQILARSLNCRHMYWDDAVGMLAYDPGDYGQSLACARYAQC
jgi:hypothetical protein